MFLLDQMGNRRNRGSRRLETLTPEKEVNDTQVGTPNPGNITLTNVSFKNPENLVGNNLGSQLTEPSLISNEIQV